MNSVMRNIKMRILIIILCIASIMTSFVPSFYADTFSDANRASEYVSIRLNELRMLYTNATKEKGNIPKLIKIYTEYIIVLDFVENTVTENPNSGYDFVLSQASYNEHVNYANTMAQEINTLYNGASYDGEEGGNPVSTSIDNKTVEFWLNNVTVGSFTLPTTSETSDRYRDEIEHIYNNYLLEMLKVTVANSLNLSSTDDISDTLTDEEINKVINTNKSIISALSSIYYAIQTDISYWNSITITGFKSNKMGELGTTNPAWVSKLIDTALNSEITDSNTPGEIVIKDANSILALLTNATMQNGSLVFDDDTANLTNLGYVLVSAGVVYDPFVSTAGNDLYLETIKEFISSEEQWDQATIIIKKAVSMKKPLYISESRETSSTGKINDAATYRKAFLADALNAIELSDKKVYQFSAVKGQMTSSKVDSSTFEYVQNFGGGSTTTELTDLAGNPIDSSSEDGNDTTSGNAAANGEYTTVGSNTLVASNTEMTEPVMYVSSLGSSFLSLNKNESSIIGTTTSVILHNAMKDAKNNDTLANSEMQMLFVNGMGDIVLADDTIILPAIANPVLYPYDNLFIDIEAIDPSIVGTRNGAEYKYTEEMDYGYYPYTATFMNHIPEITIAGEKLDKLAFANDKDADKFAIFTNSYLDPSLSGTFKNYIMASKIKSGDSSGANIAFNSDAIMPININTFSVGEDGAEYNNSSAFRIFELGQKLTIQNIASVVHNSQNLYFYKEQLYNGEKVPFFPVVEGDNINTLQTATAPLTTSARRYIAEAQDGSGDWVPTGAFNVEYLIKNMISEALLGTQYADSISKNAINSYEDIVADSPRRFEVFITGIAENVLNVLGRIDGVLAMHTGYENVIFAKIVRFIDTYYVFILIILIVIVAVKFLKNKLTMPHVLVLSAIMIACFDIYTTWLPVYIPETYNFFVNDIVEDISWKSVYNASENYSETYLSPNRVSSNGEEKPYTATVTLYQLTNGDIRKAADRLGVSETQIKTGEIIYLDQAAGIFLEGNRIKMSLDTALANKTIRGLYKSQWEALELDQNITLEPIEVSDINENPYQIRYVNGVESLDSYYTPYNEFIDSFIDNLNVMSSIFNIQRNTFSYDKDFSKDAFMVNSFIHSGLFLNPGDWETLKRNIADDSVIGGDYSIDNIRELVEAKFKYPDDWLGMSNWILEPTDAMKETLWARTLQANGYYENNWEPTDKMNDLISYVNTHTKNFIVNNVEQINYCSDENAIKLITLYATTALCDRASQYTSWMYPNYLNSADIEMEDVLYAAMTTLQDQNVAVEDSLIGTINYIYGILGVILLILILIFSNIFIFVITYFIPILYLLLGFMLIFKLVVNKNASTSIKGYAKITCTTLVLYFIYNCTLTVASSLGHHWFAIILVALSSFLCCWFLAFTIMSVFTNITDLGNATLKANLLRATNTITSGAANKFYANLRNMFARTKNYYTPKTVYQYARGKSIDDMQISHGERTIHNTEINKTYSPYRRKHIEE